MKMLELRLTAPMETALLGRWPTIMVSTMAMLIQPNSARTRGSASLSVGRNSARSARSPIMSMSELESVSGARIDAQTRHLLVVACACRNVSGGATGVTPQVPFAEVLLTEGLPLRNLAIAVGANAVAFAVMNR